MYADSKEVEIARIVQNLLEVTNSNGMQKCGRSQQLEAELQSHHVTKIHNYSVMREFSVPTNVCGMLVPSAETTWHNWLQGVNKESWYQTELIGVLFSTWLALDKFKLVFRSMYCECLACTKEKIELWEIQYGYFKLMIHVRMTWTAPITADGDSDQGM